MHLQYFAIMVHLEEGRRDALCLARCNYNFAIYTRIYRKNIAHSRASSLLAAPRAGARSRITRPGEPSQGSRESRTIRVYGSHARILLLLLLLLLLSLLLLLLLFRPVANRSELDRRWRGVTRRYSLGIFFFLSFFMAINPKLYRMR